MSAIKENLVIAGLQTHIYKTSAHLSGSVAIVFLLHGRHGSAEDIEPVATALLEKTSSINEQKRPLYIVTLDHRNHGTRLVEARANNTWMEGNNRHAMDMYSIQMGTAQDVSLLCDFLPAYLFPRDECEVAAWGIIGISLGGHSTWITLSQDPRIKVGIPIIGCPDYLELLKYRAKTSDIPFAEPYIPAKIIDLIASSDPASKNYTSLETSNPFLGKKVLVLSGEEDSLVPWTASQKFVESLEVGPQGLKKVVLQRGVGHKCTAEMVKEAADFIQSELLN